MTRPARRPRSSLGACSNSDRPPTAGPPHLPLRRRRSHGGDETSNCDNRASTSPSSAPIVGTREDATSSPAQSQARTSALVRTIGRHPFRFAYEPLGLWRALRSRQFDVIDIHEEPASLATFEVRVLARLAGAHAPYCLYSAENLPKRYPVPFRWFERSALRRAAAVHTCNEEAGELLRARGFSGRVRNLGLGVETGPLRARSVRHPTTRRRPVTHFAWAMSGAWTNGRASSCCSTRSSASSTPPSATSERVPRSRHWPSGSSMPDSRTGLPSGASSTRRSFPRCTEGSTSLWCHR